MITGCHPYRGSVAGLATRHDKLPLVGPAICRSTGLEVVSIDVDTDSLGTFAGEVPRAGSPWETAVAKARLGMQASGLPLGLASEGSIGPDPAVPFLISGLELVVLVDDVHGITVGETDIDFELAVISVELSLEAAADLAHDSELLRTARFPSHGLIVRPGDGFAPLFKGIHDFEELQSAIEVCAGSSGGATVRIESDLRALHHPGRRQVIARASERLAARLASRCPRCGCPGWGVGERIPGARCSECRRPTRVIREEALVCGACSFRESRPVAPSTDVDPVHCLWCNP